MHVNGGNCVGGGVTELSVLSAQLFCKSATALKDSLFLF